MPNDTNIVPTKEQTIAPVERPELKADKSWYSSAITQLLAPLVGTRYIWLTLEEINPFNFLGKTTPKLTHDEKIIKYDTDKRTILNKADITPYKESSFGRYASRNFAAYGMGTGLFMLIGIYSKNTLNDIKSIYAEAVGYELGKNSKDVTISDVFIKSQNEAVKVTCSAYLKRTLIRFGTAATFFVPWEKFRSKPFQYVQPKYDVNADAGVGAVGALIYGEGFLRKQSFFDFEQKLVSSKINHKDVDPYSAIQPQDVQALINLYRKHLNTYYQAPLAESPEGQNDIKLADRIAKLLNDTYDNKPDIGTDRFTMGKLNYLIGFGMLEKFPESLAYVELANKSADMKEVKQAVSAIEAGEDVKKVFARFGADIQKLSAKPEQQTEIPVAESKRFTQDVAPKTLMDFATKSLESKSKTI